jgi:ankyrin repeat protein
MSFQCTTCSIKPYDKAWKLQRHIRETRKCFERLHPGTPANHLTRFQCTSCSYKSPRELDLKRHRRQAHGETANETTSGHDSTSSADATRKGVAHVDTTLLRRLLRPKGLHERQGQLSQSNAEFANGTTICDPLTISATFPILPSPSSLQSTTPPTTDEDFGNIARFDSHLTTTSPSITKRKYPDQYRLSVDSKRICAEGDVTSNIGIRGITTNTTDILGPDCEQENAPEMSLFLLDHAKELLSAEVRQYTERYSENTQTINGAPLILLGIGGWIDPPRDDSLIKRSEVDQSIADALANIDLTSSAKGRKTSATVDSRARDWIQLESLGKELKALPCENSDSFHGWGPRLWTESNPAPSDHASPSIATSKPERKSTAKSSVGIPQSIAASPSSKGSLFGIPSTHSYKPWMTWSSGCPTQASAVKSLHSTGMPAPMLNSGDEELSLSRVWASDKRHQSSEPLQATPREQFVLAAANNDLDRLRLLVEDLAFDYNGRDYKGRTALVWAAQGGHHQAVKVLLSNSCDGVDVNSRDNHGMTAIMYACQRGDLGVFDSILSLPTIDISVQSSAGPTALMMAIQSIDIDGTTAMVQKLVAYAQKRPDYHTTAARWDPFFNAPDASGLTPLHWAVKLGVYDYVSTLLDTGRVDVDRKAFGGITPAMQAVEEITRPEILALLFDSRACDPTLVNEDGETLVGVARRVMEEREEMLVDHSHRSVPTDPRRLQMAWDNLRLCVAYEHDCTGAPEGSNPQFSCGGCGGILTLETMLKCCSGPLNGPSSLSLVEWLRHHRSVSVQR